MTPEQTVKLLGKCLVIAFVFLLLFIALVVGLIDKLAWLITLSGLALVALGGITLFYIYGAIEELAASIMQLSKLKQGKHEDYS